MRAHVTAIQEAYAPLFAVDAFIEMSEIVRTQVSVNLLATWNDQYAPTRAAPGTWTYKQMHEYVAPMILVLADGVIALEQRLFQYFGRSPDPPLDKSFFELHN